MQRHQKEAFVEELGKQLDGIGVVILSDFSGMDVETANEIRRRFREVDVQFRVVKNTLARRVFAEKGLEPLVEHLTGPNGLVMSESDPIAPAKILVEFEKSKKTPKIKLGCLHAMLLSGADGRKLAALPTREGLLGQTAAGFHAAVVGFARLLHELTRRLVATLDEVGKQKAEV
ncbi:50S ribosomal protein L10 [bacterium]|nr:50S ribosomal protein L10 [bacterium]